MKPLLRSLRYGLTTLLDRLAPRGLPEREQPLHLTVEFHVEHIADE